MKNKTQNQLINDLLQSSTVKYVLYGIGAIALIYVSGIVMKVVGNTANSYKFMSNALNQ
jgi:bacteriorhodopsin